MSAVLRHQCIYWLLAALLIFLTQLMIVANFRFHAEIPAPVTLSPIAILAALSILKVL